jgi:hypothetical protein
MPRSKKSEESEPQVKKTATAKARILQGATENTRSSRRRFAIPPVAFGRVARAIIQVHGHEFSIGKISPKALEALQRFTEGSIVDQLDKARIIMGDKARTLKVSHLKIANKIAHSGAGTRLESFA